ncbi:MAG: hypothetical protein WBY53_04670 [Acidobacteriaceae bacterium]
MESSRMRRVLAILLFWATLFPMVASALSTGAMGQSMLPACCRRGGKHHCSMSAEEQARILREFGDQIRVGAPPMQCPYRQRSLAPAHLQVFTVAGCTTHAAFLLRAPSAAAQAECLRRISFDRSRQKRGPPSLLS